MIAANIGKIFLEAYNEKFKCNYSAKEFFVEKYFELFFNHGKYMQWVTNSPFVQGIKKGVIPTIQERKIKLDTPNPQNTRKNIFKIRFFARF